MCKAQAARRRRLDIQGHTWELTMPMPAMEAMFMVICTWGALHQNCGFIVSRALRTDLLQAR